MTKNLPAYALAQIWSPASLAIVAKLGETSTRAVGGCVRDALLGRPIGDIDLATTHEPAVVMDRLQNAGIKVKPTGFDHGTVTAIIGKAAFEITSLRADVATDGRRAVVRFTKDWTVDAQRRDLTINAFYADINGHVYDGSGQGFDDLAARQLRFIGDAATRIAEDQLRLLRLFRFTAQLDGFSPESTSLQACYEAGRAWTGTLSGERITAEFNKLLMGSQACQALTLMGARYFEIRSEAPELIGRLNAIKAGRLSLAYILAFGDHIPERFVFSRKERTYIDRLLTLRDNPMTWRECAYRYGMDMAVDVYLWRCLGGGEPADWLDEIESYRPPKPPSFTQTCQDLGYAGAALGEKIKDMTERWIEDQFK